MILDFDVQKIFSQSLKIDDPGHCCLKCTDQYGYDYYIRTQSVMGTIFILKFGPCLEDEEFINNNFELSYKKAKWSEGIIKKEISSYINDPKKCIADVIETTDEDVLRHIPTNNHFIAL